MKWYNNDKTFCIDFDSIQAWEYIGKPENNETLVLYISSSPGGLFLYRDNAKELYKKLTS